MQNEIIDKIIPVEETISDAISKISFQHNENSLWKRAEFTPDDLLTKKSLPDLFGVYTSVNVEEIDEIIFESVFDMRFSISSLKINQSEFKNLIELFVQCYLKGFFRSLDLALYFYKEFTLLYWIAKKTSPNQLLKFLEIKNSFSKSELVPMIFTDKAERKVIYRTLLSGFIVENQTEIESKNITTFLVIEKLVSMGISVEHENNNALILSTIQKSLDYLHSKKRPNSFL